MVIVCNLEGQQIRAINVKHQTGNGLYWNSAVALDGHGGLWITDYLGGCLYILDTDSGRLLHTIRSKGTGPGEFKGPCRLVFTYTGLLAVCEILNKRIQILSM